MKPESLAKGLLPVVGVVGAAWAIRELLHPWWIYWGATTEEIIRPMPLDEEVMQPRLNTTIAVGINSTPEEVWPWIPQIGDPPRGGYYSYTWVERLLGMHIQNSEAVLSQYQHPQVGESLDQRGTMVVKAVEPGKYLVLGPPPSVDWMKCTWAFGIYPSEAGTTRLVTRVQAGWRWTAMLAKMPLPTWPLYLFIEPGAFVMERKMLLEIKKRAERLHRSHPNQPATAFSHPWKHEL